MCLQEQKLLLQHRASLCQEGQQLQLKQFASILASNLALSLHVPVHLRVQEELLSVRQRVRVLQAAQVVHPRVFGRVNQDRLHLRQKERRQRLVIIVGEMQGRMERTVHLRRSRKESKTCDEEEGHRSRPLPVPRHSNHSR